MRTTKYVIMTQMGYVYEVDKNGYVLRYSSNGLDKRNAPLSELKTWQIVGVQEIKPFNQLGQLIPLVKIKNIKDWLFKNGNSRYTIHDIDHGTHRIYGNWKYHGIRNIETIK